MYCIQLQLQLQFPLSFDDVSIAIDLSDGIISQIYLFAAEKIFPKFKAAIYLFHSLNEWKES